MLHEITSYLGQVAAMESQRVIAFGHSHLGALNAAYEKTGPEPSLSYALTTYQFLRSDRPHIVNVDNSWRYNPEIERELLHILDQTTPIAVVIMLQGDQAISSGLTAPAKPYDFFFPGEVGYSPSPGTEIIPFDLALSACKKTYHLIADFLDLIRDRLPPVSFALCPPPPVGDREFILSSSTRHGNISSHIEKFGLPDAAWRRRIWKLHTTALRSVYEERSIAFIDPPPESFDEAGCLRIEYRGDVFHANVAYGQMLLDQIGQSLLHPNVWGTHNG